MAEALAAAVGWALTGTDLGPGPAPEADLVVEWLDASGWSAERLAAHRSERQGTNQPWPDQPPAGWVEGWARYASLLRQVRELTGLNGLTASLRSQRPLSADERRLLADKPPHHGSG